MAKDSTEMRYKPERNLDNTAYNEELLDFYGVKGINYTRAGKVGGDQRTLQEVEADLVNAAQQRYDTRRTLEAAGLAGDEWAREVSAKGFRDANDVYQAQRFFEESHKELMGNGGEFSSNTDTAGLTDYFVNKANEKPPEEAPTLEPPELGPQFNISADEANKISEERDKRIKDYEKNRATQGFYRNPSVTDFSAKGASDYMDKYRFNVKKGMNDAGMKTRGPELPDFAK